MNNEPNIKETEKKKIDLTIDDVKSFADSNCKRCYGRGFDSFYMDKDGNPVQAIMCKCVRRNMKKTESKIKF
jgi:hypothetical protein